MKAHPTQDTNHKNMRMKPAAQPNTSPFFGAIFTRKKNEVRQKIKDKDIAYRNKNNDPETFRTTKLELRKCIETSKKIQRDKLEAAFSAKDSKKLWAQMSLITVLNTRKSVSQPTAKTQASQINSTSSMRGSTGKIPPPRSHSHVTIITHHFLSQSRKQGAL
ncbi:hypothetical protein ElyMa_003661700 [Elysia marginata]|uniref:Uncharacterized protein n=1 Tax=Elysia marginata TaxID=1093978 RepID=A0AAV4EZ63_9GAST|nr:hypothetical protein ElyMa_003661700 [Elysia marginata]